ncbi:MAG: regulatory protein RecX [Dokdonella sp.]
MRPPRKPKEDTRSVYDKALGLLARREHSARELKTKLAVRGHTASEAVVAIDRLQDQQYQNDDRFAASLARRRAAQGYGPRRIGAELRSHGLGDASIREVLTEAGLDWTAIASEQLRKRFGGSAPRDRAERGKRADVLLRRGFDPATVRAVTCAEVDDPGTGFD